MCTPAANKEPKLTIDGNALHFAIPLTCLEGRILLIY